MNKKLIMFLATFLFIVLLSPINTKALQEKTVEQDKLLTCEYEYQNSNNITEKLVYEVYSNSVNLAFNNGTKFNNLDTPWYHGANFEEIFLESSKINGNTYTCPVLTVEENNNFITVFNNPKAQDKCNGTCKNLVSTKEMSHKKGIATKKVISTSIGGSVGIYKSTKYILPYFRLLEDGSKEWSINGKKYIAVDEVAVVNDGKNKIKIALNEDLINKIFNDNATRDNIEIYRCVTSPSKNNYTYLLSLTSNTCPKKDLSKKDNQENKSTSYDGAFGEPEKKDTTQEDLEDWLDDYDKEQKCSGEDSLLGNPADEDSVAWLLQQILNYLKILGPMIVVIMSSVDFGKAIIQSDDESMSKAQKKLIYRLLLAASLFFLPNLVSVLLNIFGITSDPLCGLE